MSLRRLGDKGLFGKPHHDDDDDETKHKDVTVRACLSETRASAAICMH